MDLMAFTSVHSDQDPDQPGSRRQGFEGLTEKLPRGQGGRFHGVARALGGDEEIADHNRQLAGVGATQRDARHGHGHLIHREGGMLRSLYDAADDVRVSRLVGAPHGADRLRVEDDGITYLQPVPRDKHLEGLNHQTLEARKRVLGPEHPDTLSSMNNLALAYHALGRDKEAEALFRQTLDIRRRVIGPEHSETLTSMNNLAGIYWIQGRQKESEALFRHTLEIQQRVLGPEHPETLRSMNNLAEVQSGLGRHQEAEALCRRTLEIQKHVLGPGHPDTLTVMNTLAGVLSARGRHQEAEALRREALELQKRAPGVEREAAR